METQAEEIVASFTVENEGRELKQVLIVQDILPYYRKEDTYRKRFRLENLEGDVVYPTKNPNILKLANGYILKKTNR